MSEATQKKAEKYLIDGRVKVKTILDAYGVFHVLGSEPYLVRFIGSVWDCSCPAQVECAHIIACRLVTEFSKDNSIVLGHDEDIDALLTLPPKEDFSWDESEELG